jgi:SH3 domain protein
MKFLKLCAAGLMMLLAASTVSAKTMYVNDLLKLMVRSGKGLDNRILAIIESGDPVNVVEEGEQWSKVRAPDGKEGWVLSRYLTSQETASHRLAELEALHAQTVTENESLRGENQKLKDENASLSGSLTANSAEFDALRQADETLRRESANFLKLKKNFAAASEQAETLQRQNQEIAASLARLERDRNIRWFITGASVLLVGFLIGLSSRSKRRKPSLL